MEIVGTSPKKTILRVHPSISPYVYFQCFMNEAQNKEFKAYILSLADYSVVLNINVDENTNKFIEEEKVKQETFNQRIAKLNKLDPSDVVNFFRLFGMEISERESVKIVKIEDGWLVLDGVKVYKIVPTVGEFQLKTNKIFTKIFTLPVYRISTEGAKRLYDLRKLSNTNFGINPDCPGPELMAYLDQYSIDEITNFIAYLRKPYRAENSIYIHYASKAIWRKSKMLKFTDESTGDPLGGTVDIEISLFESADKHSLYYDDNKIWSEVKASNPPEKPFQVDLFLEQPLVEYSYSYDDVTQDTPASESDDTENTSINGEPDFFSLISKEPLISKDIDELITHHSCENFKKYMDDLIRHGVTSLTIKDKIIAPPKLDDLNPFALDIKNLKKSIAVVSTLKDLIEKENPAGFAKDMITPFIKMAGNIGKINKQSAAAARESGRHYGIRNGAGKLIEVIIAILEEKKNPSAMEDALKNLPAITDNYELFLQRRQFNNPTTRLFPVNPTEQKKGYIDGLKKFEDQAKRVYSDVESFYDFLGVGQVVLDNCKIGVLEDLNLIKLEELQIVMMYSFCVPVYKAYDDQEY